MEKQKTPVSIILIIIGMFISAFGLLIKQFSFGRIYMDARFLGKSLSIVNYAIDWIILAVFIIFICMFFMRKKQVNKYFIFFLMFLALGDLIGFILGFFNMSEIEQAAPYLQEVPQSFFIVVSMISFIFSLFVYYLAIHFTRKHKGYFSK